MNLETEIHHEGHEDKMLEKKGLSEVSGPRGNIECRIEILGKIEIDWTQPERRMEFCGGKAT